MVKPLRLLMVEDSEDDVMRIIHALREGGYDPKFEQVKTPPEMEAAISASKWDVILCDYELPNFSGLSALAFLKEKGVDVPLIIVSRLTGEEPVAQCIRQGALDYIAKDNLSRLVSVIDRELTNAKVKTELKKAEEALLASEYRWKELFESMDDCAAVVEGVNGGLDFIFKEFNRSAEKVDGFDRKEVIGRSLRHVFPWSAETGLLMTMREVWQNGHPKQLPASFYKDGLAEKWREHYVYRLPNGEVVILYKDVTESKKVERRLFENEQKYRMLVENSIEAIFIAQDGQLIFVNQATMELLGFSSEVLTSTPFTEFIYPQDRDLVMSNHLRRLRGEAVPTNYAIRVVTSKGEVRWVEIRSSIVSWNGKPATLNFLVDITIRREMENIIRQSEEKYRTIIEQMTDGYFEVDLSGKFTFVNDAQCRNLGYSREELIGKGNRLYVEKHKRKELYAIFGKVFETGIPVQAYELELIKKDKTKSYNEISISLIRNLEGKPIGFRGISRDVTERKQAEDKLRKYAEEISELYNKAPCGYHSLGPDGTFLRINDTELEWLGYDRDELVRKKKLSDLITLKSQEVFQKNFPLLKEQGSVHDLEYEMIRKDGSIFYVLVNSKAIRDKEGIFIQSNSTVFNISQLKKVQADIISKNLELTRACQELQEKQAIILQQEKMASIGVLAAGVAHEIKNPLAIILQGIDYLRSQVADNQLLTEVVERLGQAVTRADVIVKGLLSYARQAPVSLAKQDIRTIIDDSVLLTEHEFRAKNIQLIKNYAPDLPQVFVDANQIKQVFINLIINAIEAMQQRGKLTISATRVNESNGREVLQLSFRDTGHGIPADKLEKIFDPFFSTKASGSTGLGLSISKGIIDMHKGIIYAESINGQGANFVIKLPT